MPMTVQHAKTVTIADFTGTVTVFNSSGGTNTVNATDLARPSDWNSAHNVTYTPAASEIASLFNAERGLTLSTNTNGLTFGYQTEGYYEPFAASTRDGSVSAPAIGSWYFEPFAVNGVLNSGQLNLFVVGSASVFKNGAVYSAASTGSISRYQTLHNRVAIYEALSHGTALTTVWTGSCDWMVSWVRRVSSAATSNLTVSNFLTLSFPGQWDSLGGVTYSTTSQSGSTTVGASTGASTLADNLITGAAAYITGSLQCPVGLDTQLGPGQYWIAHMFSSTSSSTGTNYSAGTMFSTMSRQFIGVHQSLNNYKNLGSSVSSSSGSSPNIFHGYLATTTSAATASVVKNDIIWTTGGRMYWNYQKQ